ncbi:MAG: AraC family transcriptional regulator [Aquabacterium sp.]
MLTSMTTSGIARPRGDLPRQPLVLPSGWAEPRYSPVKIAAVADAVAEVGITAAHLLHRTGLQPLQLQDPDTLTSTAQLYTALTRAANLDPRPDLGLRISSYGMYGYALLCAPTLRAGLELSQRYHALANPLVPIRAMVTGDLVAWVFPRRSELALPDLDERLYRVLIQMQMAIHVTLARDAMGDWCSPGRALLDFPRDGIAGALHEALDCPVSFDQPRAELHYPAAWLDRSPQLASALTAAQTSRTCAQLLEAMEDGTSLSRRVYRELMRTPGRFPGIESIAGTLCMTGRTLRRHLVAEGTSYADLLARVRRALAEDYLRTTRMSVEDVASALAFSNARSFRQAFQRWTGQPPTVFRRGTHPP